MKDGIRLWADELRAWTEGMLEAAGLSADDARTAAEVFMRASMRGVGHHDISYLPRRLKWMRDEGVNPRPRIRRVGGGGAVEVWDGDRALGEVACSHVLDRALALAKTFGIGYASVRQSNHFLAASPYAEMGAEAGCFTMVFSNTDPCMTGPYGTKNIIGNDPMGFGAERSGGPAVIADMCMAYSSLGNLQALADEGGSVPSYWGSDASGQPTDDPAAILDGGSVRPMAEHKGFALALMTEVLTGILAGGATTDQVRSGGGVNTHNQAVIAFDLSFFGGAKSVAERVGDMTRRLKAAQPGLRIPGERSEAAREDGRRLGVPVKRSVYEELRAWSHQLGIPANLVPEPGKVAVG